MAHYTVIHDAVARAERLIDARQYALDSDWGLVAPDAEAENRYLAKHPWEDYAAWHLGLREGANDETKARHAFVFENPFTAHEVTQIAAHAAQRCL